VVQAPGYRQVQAGRRPGQGVREVMKEIGNTVAKLVTALTAAFLVQRGLGLIAPSLPMLQGLWLILVGAYLIGTLIFWGKE